MEIFFEQAKRLRLQIFIRVLAKESLELEKEIEIVSAGMKWEGETVRYLESGYPRNPFGLCQLSGEILVRNPFGPGLRICFHQQELEWKKNKDSISFEAEE